VQYLNNVLEQDHRAIKRRVRASQHFRSFLGAWRTTAGYEAIHMIRKGQAYGNAAGAKVVAARGACRFVRPSVQLSKLDKVVHAIVAADKRVSRLS
jgi:DDE domain